MDRLPPLNNVYGFLLSSTSLERVAQVIGSRFGLYSGQVSVYRSQFDGIEILHIRTEDFEFESQKAEEANT